MDNFLDKIRTYDFNGYYNLFQLDQRNHFYGDLFYFFSRYGIVFFFFSFTYLIWKKKVNAFFCTFLAMGIAGLVDFIITTIWRRPSPFVSHSDLVSPVIVNLRVDPNISFPSSHTYIAFAIAISVFLYGHKKLGTVLLALAILVAVSRVGAGLHYPSDVIGGAILGLISGVTAYFVVRRAEKNWK